MNCGTGDAQSGRRRDESLLECEKHLIFRHDLIYFYIVGAMSTSPKTKRTYKVKVYHVSGGKKPLRDPRQEKFCREYSRHGKRERAVVAAGYNCKTWMADGSTSAAVQAHYLLNQPKIQYRIQWLQENRARKADLTEAKLINELKHVAFFRLNSIYSADNHLLPVNEWPEEAQAAVAGIEYEKLYDVDENGKKKPVGWTVKVKLNDKLGAIDKLMKYFGMHSALPENVTLTVQNNEVNFYLPENPRHAKIVQSEPVTPTLIESQPTRSATIELPPKSNGSH